VAQLGHRRSRGASVVAAKCSAIAAAISISRRRGDPAQFVVDVDHATGAQVHIERHLDDHLPAAAELLDEQLAGSACRRGRRVVEHHHRSVQQPRW